MIVLCYGMTKSGSTLAFELCKAVLAAHGHVQRQLSDAVVVREGHGGNFMVRPTPEKLQRTLLELAPGEIIAIKLHARLTTETRTYLASPVARDSCRVQVSYRDPRDIALSLLDAGQHIREHYPEFNRGFARFHTLRESAEGAAVQMEVCKIWAGLPGALHLHYEDTAFAPEPVIARMCEQLGLAQFDAVTLAAVRNTAFAEAQAQKNKAMSHRHQDDLTPEQNEVLLSSIPGARPFIEKACIHRDYRWMSEDWSRGV